MCFLAKKLQRQQASAVMLLVFIITTIQTKMTLRVSYNLPSTSIYVHLGLWLVTLSTITVYLFTFNQE